MYVCMYNISGVYITHVNMLRVAFNTYGLICAEKKKKKKKKKKSRVMYRYSGVDTTALEAIYAVKWWKVAFTNRLQTNES